MEREVGDRKVYLIEVNYAGIGAVVEQKSDYGQTKMLGMAVD